MARVIPYSVTGEHVQSLVSRHRAFLQRAEAGSYLRSDGVFAPSVPVELPQPDGSVVTHAERLSPDQVDPGCLIDGVDAWRPMASDPEAIAQEQTLAFLGIGDVLPFSQPFFKIPWLEAMLGCPIKMTEGQIWVERYEGDLDELVQEGVDLEGNPWFGLYLKFLRLLQERISGRFPVTHNTLFRGPSDLVAALMGVQETCMGWILEPKRMARLLRLCTHVHKTVVKAALQVTVPFAGGYVSGYGSWTDQPVIRMQADHSSLLSPEMYREHILPFDLEIVQAFPRCIFHIHNNGLHVAPDLVAIDELDVLEVVVDPYPKRARKAHEVEMLQMILEHKPLILDVNFPSVEEAEWLLAELSPRGLWLNARFDPETFRDAQGSLPGETLWVLT